MPGMRKENVEKLNAAIAKSFEITKMLIEIKDSDEGQGKVLAKYGYKPQDFTNILKRLDICQTRENDLDKINAEAGFPTLSGMEKLFMSVMEVKNIKDVPLDAHKTMKELCKVALTKRERAVISERYNEGLTLEECGKVHGVTYDRIRQIEAKALRKLKRKTHKAYILCGHTYYSRAKEERLRKELNHLEVLKEQVRLLSEEIEIPKEAMTKLSSSREDDMLIDELELSVRSYNCLYRRGIKTIKQLASTPPEELIKVRNLGRRSYEEIRSKLMDLGMWLWTEEPECVAIK